MKNPTTRFEKLLLLSITMILPSQFYLPRIGGFGFGFIVFGIVGTYLIFFRTQILVQILRDPLFLSGYLFVGVGIYFEIAHMSFGFSEIFRIVFMMIGAVFIASLCRDRNALLVAMYGFLISAIVISSAFLFGGIYDSLSSLQVDDFAQATQARENLFAGEESSIEGDLNQMALYSSFGVIIGLPFALIGKTISKRVLYLGCGIYCLIATFLPMSRGATLILAVSCATVLYAHGALQPKVLIISMILGVSGLMLIPDAVFSRLAFSLDGSHSAVYHEEGRSRIYRAALENFPEYFLTGVGMRHYYGNWGMRHGFGHKGKVFGSHNCFAQVTLYWGLTGLVAFCFFLWQAYRCLPKGYGADPLYLGLLGIVVAVFLESFVIHMLYAKEFSLALGLLAGGARWIWPQRVARSRFNYRDPQSRRSVKMGRKFPSPISIL